MCCLHLLFTEMIVPRTKRITISTVDSESFEMQICMHTVTPYPCRYSLPSRPQHLKLVRPSRPSSCSADTDSIERIAIPRGQCITLQYRNHTAVGWNRALPVTVRTIWAGIYVRFAKHAECRCRSRLEGNALQTGQK